MARHQCRRLRVWMVKVRVAGSKVMIGAIGEVEEMAEDMTAVAAQEDLEVGVAHDGMDQVAWAVGAGVTELFTFSMICCLSVWHSFLSLFGTRTLR